MKANQAVTLIEVLLVVGVISLLLLMGFYFFGNHLNRSYDARRKSDLNKIKIAFEDYYGDYNCYPRGDVLFDYCEGGGATDLDPYLSEVPCDPQTNKSYVYQAFPNATQSCGGFRVLAALSDPSDPSVVELNCWHADGCGAGPGFEDYNYGVSEAVPVSYYAPVDDYGVLGGLNTPTPVSGDDSGSGTSGSGGEEPPPSDPVNPNPGSCAFTGAQCYVCASGACNVCETTLGENRCPAFGSYFSHQDCINFTSCSL